VNSLGLPVLFCICLHVCIEEILASAVTLMTRSLLFLIAAAQGRQQLHHNSTTVQGQQQQQQQLA
jgi:hypothetical protein